MKKANNFATKNDIKGLKSDITKLDSKIDNVEEGLNKRMDRMEKNIDFKLEPILEFKEEFSGFKNSVLKTLDWLVGAFKKFDQEHTVLSEHTRRLDDRVTTLEKRTIAS